MINFIKHFEFETLIKIKFLQLELDDNKVDSEYFIKKIEEGISQQDNMNYKTNLKGQMTSFNYFVEDKKLQKLLEYIFDNFPKNIFLGNQVCIEAWGIKCNEGDKTEDHDHICDYSAILYLNDSNTAIHFPEINTNILPKKNNFLFFSALLMHGTKRITEGCKYAIAFNFIRQKEW